MTDEERTERQRDLYLQRTYGITTAEYEAILEHQGGVCAICRKPPKKKRLAVDHDHRTSLVRGLLCTPGCNYKLLGRRDRDPALFYRAGDYLSDPPALAVIGERRVL
jgi:hypothetical protein